LFIVSVLLSTLIGTNQLTYVIKFDCLPSYDNYLFARLRKRLRE